MRAMSIIRKWDVQRGHLMGSTFNDKPLGHVMRGASGWKNWTSDDLRTHVQNEVTRVGRIHGANGLLVRMHPQTWQDVGYWLDNLDAPIFCNPEHGQISISVSNESHPGDRAC
jgi:hypothetical protein